VIFTTSGRRSISNSLTATSLLTSLPDEGNWIFNYEKNTDDVVTALFCTQRTCLEILRMNPYILIMDCTYKTNKYKMPLLDIVGILAISATFFVGFGFIQNDPMISSCEAWNLCSRPVPGDRTGIMEF
jgi:MULE transposase domain